MSKNNCPACGEALPSESINIAEGVALCAVCGQLSRLSDVVSGKRPIAEILRTTPTGCSIADLGTEIAIGASLRSLGGFLGLFVFALFWNSIVSVFLFIAFAGVYTNLIGPLPNWFPAPQMQEPMTSGMTLFLCLFLVPFVAVGAITAGTALLMLFGRIDISISETEGSVRTRIGWFAWRRRFNLQKVHRVVIGNSSWSNNESRNELIVIESDQPLKFGSMLPSERREWLQTILHELLTKKSPHERRETLALATQR